MSNEYEQGLMREYDRICAEDDILDDADPSMIECNYCNYIYDSDEHSVCPECGN